MKPLLHAPSSIFLQRFGILHYQNDTCKLDKVAIYEGVHHICLRIFCLLMCSRLISCFIFTEFQCSTVQVLVISEV